MNKQIKNITHQNSPDPESIPLTVYDGLEGKIQREALQLLSLMLRLAAVALGILTMQMQTLKSHVLISLYYFYAEV